MEKGDNTEEINLESAISFNNKFRNKRYYSLLVLIVCSVQKLVIELKKCYSTFSTLVLLRSKSTQFLFFNILEFDYFFHLKEN